MAHKTLPQWAKRLIGTLSQKVISRDKQIELLQRMYPETRTRIDVGEGCGQGPFIYVPDSPGVEFNLAPPGVRRRGYDIRVRPLTTGDGSIVLDINGDDTLEVVPWSSNLIRARMTKGVKGWQ